MAYRKEYVDFLFDAGNELLKSAMVEVCTLVVHHRGHSLKQTQAYLEEKSKSSTMAFARDRLLVFFGIMSSLCHLAGRVDDEEWKEHPVLQPLFEPEAAVKKKPTKFEFVSLLHSYDSLKSEFDNSDATKGLDFAKNATTRDWFEIICTYNSLLMEDWFPYPTSTLPPERFRLLWPSLLVFDSMSKKWKACKAPERQALLDLLSAESPMLPVGVFFEEFGNIQIDRPQEGDPWYNPEIESMSVKQQKTPSKTKKRKATASPKTPKDNPKKRKATAGPKAPPVASLPESSDDDDEDVEYKQQKSPSKTKQQKSPSKTKKRKATASPKTPKDNPKKKRSLKKPPPVASSSESSDDDDDYQKIEMGCFCSDCGSMMTTIVVPKEVFANGLKKNIYEEDPEENGVYPCFFEDEEDFEKLSVFLAKKLARRQTPNHWKHVIRKHYKETHEGMEFPPSCKKSQAYDKIAQLYNDEVEKAERSGIRILPQKHSFSTFKKHLQGNRADPDKLQEYQELLNIAYPDSVVKERLIEMMHWYWDEKCK
jgi:hypothetical protein